MATVAASAGIAGLSPIATGERIEGAIRLPAVDRPDDDIDRDDWYPHQTVDVKKDGRATISQMIRGDNAPDEVVAIHKFTKDLEFIAGNEALTKHSNAYTWDTSVTREIEYSVQIGHHDERGGRSVTGVLDRVVFTVTFVIGTETAATTDVELEPGKSTTVTFEHTFEAPGTYTLRVNEIPIETITVEAAETQTASPTATPTETPTVTASDDTSGATPTAAGTDTPPETETETPGFGLVTAVTGIGSAVGSLLYRNEDDDQ